MFRSHDPYIFHYWDGTYRRSADPVKLEMVLEEHLGTEWKERLGRLIQKPPLGAIGDVYDKFIAEQMELRTKVLHAIDVAFEVHEYTHPPGERPHGLTETGRLGLLTALIRFNLDLVRLARPFVLTQSRASPTQDDPQPQSAQESVSAGET